MDKNKEDSEHSGIILAHIKPGCQYPYPQLLLGDAEGGVEVAFVTPLRVRDRPVNVQVLRARVAEFLHHYFPEARGPVLDLQHGDSENYAVITWPVCTVGRLREIDGGMRQLVEMLRRDFPSVAITGTPRPTSASATK